MTHINTGPCVFDQPFCCPKCRLVIEYTTGVPGGLTPPEIPNDVKTLVMICSACESMIAICPGAVPPILLIPPELESTVPWAIMKDVEALRIENRKRKAAGWSPGKYAQ